MKGTPPQMLHLCTGSLAVELTRDDSDPTNEIMKKGVIRRNSPPWGTRNLTSGRSLHGGQLATGTTLLSICTATAAARRNLLHSPPELGSNRCLLSQTSSSCRDLMRPVKERSLKDAVARPAHHPLVEGGTYVDQGLTMLDRACWRSDRVMLPLKSAAREERRKFLV
jgi:hypothetical protein